MQVDPITVEIVQGALKAAGGEMGVLIERTAMSACIRGKKDFLRGSMALLGTWCIPTTTSSGPGC